MTRLAGAVDLAGRTPTRWPPPCSHPRRPSRRGDLAAPLPVVGVQAKRSVPPWSRDDGLYREAFARLRGPAPAYDADVPAPRLPPGNVLVDDGRVSGVVDWVETSTGPADLDVAHCASNLAGLHGVEAALAFRRAYVDQGGVLARTRRRGVLAAARPRRVPPGRRRSRERCDGRRHRARLARERPARPDVDVARARREDCSARARRRLRPRRRGPSRPGPRWRRRRPGPRRTTSTGRRRRRRGS